MAVNTGQIDLNSEAVLLDREIDVVGVKSLESNVASVGVSCSRTLSDDPVSGGDVVVRDQKVFHPEDNRGVNGSVVVLYSMNHECDVMISDSGKEGFDGQLGLVDVGLGLEEGMEVVDGGCDEKERVVSCGMEKNEDEKIGIECSDGVLFAYGGSELDGGLVTEFNDGFRGKLEFENAMDVTENGLLSAEVAANNVAQGYENDVVEECEDAMDATEIGFLRTEVAVNNLTQGANNDAVEQCEDAMDITENGFLSMEVAVNNLIRGGDNDAAEEVENAPLVNLKAVVEDDSEKNAADSLVSKYGLKDLCTAEIATDQLQDDIPCIEVVNVNAEESLHGKDLLRNCLELEPSFELEKPAYQVDAQVDVMQDQTMGAEIVEGRVFENNQKQCLGVNLVVDLNTHRNMQEYQGSVFSELNLCLSDLVWGKVTGHPWWPGQIIDASAASEKAKRHLKKDCYLVAYFGDQTFAWNDVSMIKPFQAHFSQMEKQSHLDNFYHAVNCALDEVSRRVEFGLSCPCIPEDVFFKLKTQVFSNAGINNQLSRRNGGDTFINSMSFEPMKLVNYVKSLAQSPFALYDRLNSVVAHAQLLAFYRSKGYSQLPEFTVLGRLFDNDMETHVGHSLQEYKHISGDSKRRGKKHKLMSDLMSERSLCISNGEHTSEQKVKSVPRRRGRKRKIPYNAFVISEMTSQLCLAAKHPTGESFSSDMIHFFAEFRNSVSLEYSAFLEQEMFLEQMHDGETGATSTGALASMTSAVEPCTDSYWTDRIIQSIPEKQSLTKYQNERANFLPDTQTEANHISFKLSPSAEISTVLAFEQQDTDSILGLESSKPAEHCNESSSESFCPTALTLKFSNLDSVPSTTDLNKIFGRFGPLIQSKTELLERTKRARVVFLRRSDAETAFSSAGKYSIFGPSLVSYRLKILPRKPQKVPGKRGRKRKLSSSEDGTAQKVPGKRGRKRKLPSSEDGTAQKVPGKRGRKRKLPSSEDGTAQKVPGKRGRKRKLPSSEDGTAQKVPGKRGRKRKLTSSVDCAAD